MTYCNECGKIKKEYNWSDFSTIGSDIVTAALHQADDRYFKDKITKPVWKSMMRETERAEKLIRSKSSLKQGFQLLSKIIKKYKVDLSYIVSREQKQMIQREYGVSI